MFVDIIIQVIRLAVVITVNGELILVIVVIGNAEQEHL
jgi:hypothetical protein